MFVLVIAKQLAPFKHSYVEKFVADLVQNAETRIGKGPRLQAGLALSSAKVGDIPCETGAEDDNSTETFAARQWLAPTLVGNFPTSLTASGLLWRTNLIGPDVALDP